LQQLATKDDNEHSWKGNLLSV